MLLSLLVITGLTWEQQVNETVGRKRTVVKRAFNKISLLYCRHSRRNACVRVT
jgi:hypothetical protein